MELSSVEHKQTINYYEYVCTNIQPDIDLVVKNKIIKAHKQVLESQNPVFMDIFLLRPDLTKMEILDLDAEAVQSFIHYLYTSKLSLRDVTEKLLLVAHKYSSSTLKNICLEKLGKNWTIENAVERFLAFIHCNEKKLIEETSIFIAQNFNDIKNRQLVFEKKETFDAIFNAFALCKTTVLLENAIATTQELINSAMTSDLTIKVKDHYFMGHKKILTTRNTVFKTVIAALPTTYNIASSISIPDFDPATFNIFLNYIYTQQIDEADISEELLDVAHKYVDSKLLKICEDGLMLSAVSEENAIKLLILSTNVGSQKLKKKATAFIVERYAKMTKRDDFRKLKHNHEAMEAICNQFAAAIDSLKIQKSTLAFVGTFELKLSVTVGRVHSETFYMRNVAWDIFAMVSKNDLTHLGLYLHCKDEKVCFNYNVNYSLKLLSSVSQTYDVASDNVTFRFTNFNPSWGPTQFISLSDLCNQRKGLLKNGNITIQLSAKLNE